MDTHTDPSVAPEPGPEPDADPDVDPGGELPPLLNRALSARWGPFTMGRLSDANQGRGVFSRVIRVELAWPGRAAEPGRPDSVIVKVPAAGPNGAAATASGACRREALAYTEVLGSSPIGHPVAHLVEVADDGSARLVLEDLTGHRFVDQIDGLGADDARRVADALARFHHRWRHDPALARLDVRRAAPAAMAPEALARGLGVLADRWAGTVGEAERATLARLLDRRQELVARFSQAEGPTLCHGDPRADNLAFAADGEPVLFDWQQLAVQLPEADLAWLAATSLTVETRRAVERDLVAGYGTTFDRYRLGFVLPGLAVLLLAQREIDSERTATFVATSLQRIATAVADLELA